MAFDLLWGNGRDLRKRPLRERRALLRDLAPVQPSMVLYADYVEERGRQFFASACDLDLEGIVAKWKQGAYLCDGVRTNWIKIKNPSCSQTKDRHELFADLQRGRASSSSRRSARVALDVAAAI